MKLTRRSAILALITSIFSIYLNRSRFVNAQSLVNLTPLNAMPYKQKREIFEKLLNLAEQQSQKYPYKNKDRELPPLLYWGLTHQSLYEPNIDYYPNRLKTKPNSQNLLSISRLDRNFVTYPARGVIPEINQKSLSFLHEDIKEACICLGSFNRGKFLTKWLGRNALKNGEFWSATKIIPLIYILHRTQNKNPFGNPKNYIIQGLTNKKTEASLSFEKMARDLVSYQNDSLENEEYSSNSLGAMLKGFVPQEKLETWLKEITGNKTLTFRGKYGVAPFIEQPRLIDFSTGEVILGADSKPANFCDCNNLSAYDLTRMISLIGWNYYLAKEARIFKLQNSGLGILIKALRSDPARLTDLAMDQLGIQKNFQNFVILSKLGNGSTSYRRRTEAVYVALIQGIDYQRMPAKQITLTMTLRGGLALKNRYNDSGETNLEVLEQERIQLDARMATEVTEILWRVLNNKI